MTFYAIHNPPPTRTKDEDLVPYFNALNLLPNQAVAHSMHYIERSGNKAYIVSLIAPIAVTQENKDRYLANPSLINQELRHIIAGIGKDQDSSYMTIKAHGRQSGEVDSLWNATSDLLYCNLEKWPAGYTYQGQAEQNPFAIGFRLTYATDDPGAVPIKMSQKYGGEFTLEPNVPVYLEIYFIQGSTTYTTRLYINGVLIYERPGSASFRNHGIRFSTADEHNAFFRHSEFKRELQIRDIYVNSEVQGPLRVRSLEIDSLTPSGDWFATDTSGRNEPIEGANLVETLSGGLRLSNIDVMHPDNRVVVSADSGQSCLIKFKRPTGIDGTAILGMHALIDLQQPISQASKGEYSIKAGEEVLVAKTQVTAVASRHSFTSVSSVVMDKTVGKADITPDYLGSVEFQVSGTKL